MNTIIIDNNKNKSKHIIIKEIDKMIEKNRSFLIYDLKEEYYNFYKENLISKNYNINVINMKELSLSNSFNPLLLPYNYYNSDVNTSCDLLQKLWSIILKNKVELTKIAVSFSLILFELSKKEAINLYSISNILQTSILNLKKLNSNYLTDFYNLNENEQEQILKEIKDELNKYLIYENLSNIISYSNINYKNKNAYFFIPSKKNENLNNLFFVFANQIKYIYENELNTKLGLILEKMDDNMELLDEYLKGSSEIVFSCDDIESYKKYYMLDRLDLLYNILDNDTMIKVSKKSKDKMQIEDLGVKDIVTKRQYPKTEIRDKYLFHLNKYIEKNKN